MSYVITRPSVNPLPSLRPSSARPPPAPSCLSCGRCASQPANLPAACGSCSAIAVADEAALRAAFQRVVSFYQMVLGVDVGAVLCCTLKTFPLTVAAAGSRELGWSLRNGVSRKDGGEDLWISQVRIMGGLAPVVAEHVLAHEVAHCLLWMTGLRYAPEDREEAFCNAVAALYLRHVATKEPKHKDMCTYRLRRIEQSTQHSLAELKRQRNALGVFGFWGAAQQLR